MPDLSDEHDHDEEDEHGFGLLLPFDSDDPEFCRGFEAGCLWERMKSDQAPWDQMIHGANAEMAMRMAEVQEREYRAEILPDDWVHIFIG